jgi:hypothetical protein
MIFKPYKYFVMKKMTYSISIIIILIAALTNSCTKNIDHKLPPLTSEGKNTFGCKIDGVSWVPKGIYNWAFIDYPTSGGYYGYYNSPLVHIETNDPSGHVDLYIKNYDSYNYLKPGKYLLNKNTSSLPFGYGTIHSYGTYWTNDKEYITDSLHTGWIELIKSDSINKIVSGRFAFDAYNSVNGKTYKITDGGFDYKNH